MPSAFPTIARVTEGDLELTVQNRTSSAPPRRPQRAAGSTLTFHAELPDGTSDGVTLTLVLGGRAVATAVPSPATITLPDGMYGDPVTVSVYVRGPGDHHSSKDMLFGEHDAHVLCSYLIEPKS